MDARQTDQWRVQIALTSLGFFWESEEPLDLTDHVAKVWHEENALFGPPKLFASFSVGSAAGFDSAAKSECSRGVVITCTRHAVKEPDADAWARRVRQVIDNTLSRLGNPEAVVTCAQTQQVLLAADL